MLYVRCPNCHGRDSSHWPGGPCTVYNGKGQTTLDKANEVIENRRKDKEGKCTSSHGSS